MYISRLKAKGTRRMARTGSRFSCQAFEKDYCEYDATCKVCDSIEKCAKGTALLWNVSSKELNRLPEFLVHEREDVREAAKERLERIKKLEEGKRRGYVRA
jgi:hypothetical protein